MTLRRQSLFDRLALHVAIFEKVSWRNMASDDEAVKERGKEAAILASDLREAMSFIRSHDGECAPVNGEPDGSR